MNTLKFESSELVDAISVNSQTLAAFNNQFSVEASDGKIYQICNFVFENLEEALALNLITWPIKILPIQDQVAAIADSRIPPQWFCRPRERVVGLDLLPWDLQILHRLSELRGDYKDLGNGVASIKIGSDQFKDWGKPPC